jgi:two-component SAPR family response regulator
MKISCIIVEDIQIAADFLRKFCEKSDLVEVKGHFMNVADALEFLDRERVDLLFLDVEMPGANGFDLLDRLTYSPMIILTTSKTEYAFNAFQYHVDDYLKKPFTYKRFRRRSKNSGKTGRRIPAPARHSPLCPSPTAISCSSRPKTNSSSSRKTISSSSKACAIMLSS